MRSDYPPALLRALAVLDVPFTLGLLGLGIFYVVTGNTGGEVLGAVLVAIAGWRASLLVRAIAGR